MFVYLLAALLAAAAIHIARSEDRSMARIGRIGLLYILIGYCGLPMVAVSVWTLVSPDSVARWLGFPAANPFQTFLGFAYLAMSIIAVLALRFRGAFLIGPAVGWTVFFAGATYVHLKDLAVTGSLTHHGMLIVFVTHGLISLLLAAALLSSGLLTERA